MITPNDMAPVPQDTSDQTNLGATTSNPATAQPQPPTPQPSAAQPAPAAPAPTQAPAAQKPSLHAKIFDTILKGMSGGGIKIVAPDGSIKTVGGDRASMGKSIVAAALTGLMTPTQYRQTPYGPVIDYSASAGKAMENVQAQRDKAQQQAQGMSDQQQAHKLMTLQNNAKLFQLQMASANMKHAFREQSTAEISDYLKPFNDYNEQRDAGDPNTPDAFLFRAATHEEALQQAKRFGLTEANLLRDGWKPYVDPQTHEQEWEPTYTAINPALKNIQLSPEVADRLSAMNSQFANIHKTVGGDVKLPVGLYVSALHDYQALQQTQDVVNRLNKTLNGKDAKDIDIAPIVKANRNLMVPALYKIQQAVAAGHGPEDGENPANILDVITSNAPSLLKSLGLTTGDAMNKVTELTAKRAAALARAKNEGTDKEVADPELVNGLVDAATQLPENQRKTVLPILQSKIVTKADAKKAQTTIAGFQKANQSDATRNALAGGSPEEIGKFAHNVARGDISQIDKLPSRGDARVKAMNAVHDEAVNLGLDSTKYTDSYLKTKADMQNDYAQRKGKTTGAQLASFDGFLGHVGGAMDALGALKSRTVGLTRQPLVNIASDAVGKQITDSAEWKRWETSLAPVRNEISNFLAAGYSPKEDEQKSINTILDKHETPARIMAAIGQLAETADVRLAALGRGYTQTMDTNYPELLSPDALNSMKRAGIQSKAAAFSGALPRGWDAQGGFQNVTDVNLAKRFVAAAGGNRQRAVDLARANGWILQ
jgi:hypothetical protein